MSYSAKLSHIWSDDSLFVEDDSIFVGSQPVFTRTEIGNYRTFAELYAWRRCHDQLISYLALSDDWDGDGAEAPNEALIHSALELLRGTQNAGWSAPARILPTSTGTVLFEWQSPNQYTEAEVARPGFVEWMEQDNEEQPQHWTSVWRTPDSEELDNDDTDGNFSNRGLQRPRGFVVSGGREVA